MITKFRPTALRATLVTAFAVSSLAASVAVSTPASATVSTPKCTTAADGRGVCTEIYYDSYGTRMVQGWITGGYTYSRNVTLQQCDGNGLNCGAYSATASSEFTTPKPVSFGHTYKTVASWKNSSSGPTYGPYWSPLVA